MQYNEGESLRGWANMLQEYSILVSLLEPRNDFHLENLPNNIVSIVYC